MLLVHLVAKGATRDSKRPSIRINQSNGNDHHRRHRPTPTLVQAEALRVRATVPITILVALHSVTLGWRLPQWEAVFPSAAVCSEVHHKKQGHAHAHVWRETLGIGLLCLRCRFRSFLITLFKHRFPVLISSCVVFFFPFCLLHYHQCCSTESEGKRLMHFRPAARWLGYAVRKTKKSRDTRPGCNELT